MEEKVKYFVKIKRPEEKETFQLVQRNRNFPSPLSK